MEDSIKLCGWPLSTVVEVSRTRIKGQATMKLEVADYIELEDGGAVVVLEMDEETRTGLISEAIQRIILEALESMTDKTQDDTVSP